MLYKVSILIKIQLEFALNNPYNAPTADMTVPESSAGTYQPRIFALNGRLGRLRYFAYGLLWSGILLIPYFIALAVVGIAALSTGWAKYAWMAPVYVGSVILATRRLADLGHSRWFAGLMVVPYLNVIPSLYFLFKAGDEEANEYGPPPCPNTRGVVAAAWTLPVVMVLGIVAAVAIPTYQAYTHRAQTANAPGSKL